VRNLLETSDINQAVSFEQSLPPGRYRVTIPTTEPVREEVLYSIQDELLQHGFILLSDVRQSNSYPNEIYVEYRRPAVEEGVGFAWAAIIPLIVPIATVAAVIFGIIKIEDISTALVPLVCIVGGITLILVAILREPIGGAIRKKYG